MNKQTLSQYQCLHWEISSISAPVWLTCKPTSTNSTKMNHYEAMPKVSSVLPSLSISTTHTLTHTLNLHTDTESQWYYSWNVCYVCSTNERMKENKQRGQIKREKGLRAENTPMEKRKRGIQASPAPFVFPCMLYMIECFSVQFSQD